MLTHKSGVHDVGIVQHELLDSRASTGSRVPKLVKSLEEREPVEGLVGSGFCRAVIDKPLSQTLKCKSINTITRKSSSSTHVGKFMFDGFLQIPFTGRN